MDIHALANTLERGGRYIKLRRQTGRGLYIEVRCAARVTKWTPEIRLQIEAAGGIAQGHRICVISNREILREKWPGPPRRGDLVIVEGDDEESGNTAFVTGCDTSDVDGITTRHDITLRGT
jgi:hypothetical protein